MGFFEKWYRAMRIADYTERRMERNQRKQQKLQKEIQERKQREEDFKKYKAKREIEDEVNELKDNLNCILYPLIYNEDKHINTERISIYNLENRIYSLRAKLSNTGKYEYSVAKIDVEFLIKSLQEAKEQIESKTKQEEDKTPRPVRINNPVVYNKLLREVTNKKFKNEKEKMKMIKIIGQSGLSTEERKTLISMIK